MTDIKVDMEAIAQAIEEQALEEKRTARKALRKLLPTLKGLPEVDQARIWYLITTQERGDVISGSKDFADWIDEAKINLYDAKTLTGETDEREGTGQD